jgi:vacuole morphology and inheritance protein 14
MVPFTPRLVYAVLPNLAHHAPMIQSAATRTNKLLLNVVQSLPPPSEPSSRQNTDKASVSGPPTTVPGSPPPVASSGLSASRPSTAGRESTIPIKEATIEIPAEVSASAGTPSSAGAGSRPRPSTAQTDGGRTSNSLQASVDNATQNSRPDSPASAVSAPMQLQQSPEASLLQEKDKDLFDYQHTVNALTIQFLSEHEETRVAALKWLIMLHQKAPKKVRVIRIWRYTRLNAR